VLLASFTLRQKTEESDILLTERAVGIGSPSAGLLIQFAAQIYETLGRTSDLVRLKQHSVELHLTESIRPVVDIVVIAMKSLDSATCTVDIRYYCALFASLPCFYLSVDFISNSPICEYLHCYRDFSSLCLFSSDRLLSVLSFQSSRRD